MSLAEPARDKAEVSRGWLISALRPLFEPIPQDRCESAVASLLVRAGFKLHRHSNDGFHRSLASIPNPVSGARAMELTP